MPSDLPLAVAPGSARRPTLGEMLERLGLISPIDLVCALERQAQEGGRLGTCLLDLGLLDESALLAALGALQGVATADARALEAAPPELAHLLPARAAQQTQSVPLARRGRAIEVAMSDPTLLPRVDELAAVTGLRIEPRLGLELRIGEALERIYSIELDPRLGRTRARLARRAQVARDAPGDDGA